MPEINTRFLFTLALEIQVSSLGDTPYGRRRMFHFDGGSFDGPKLKGKVLPGGGGWSLIRRDDVMEVDARLILETNDSHQIYAAWKGLRHGPKEVMDRLYKGEIVDPGAYYFRTTPYFETSSEKYSWMNRICSIASGSLSANARTLDVFQVLLSMHQTSLLAALGHQPMSAVKSLSQMRHRPVAHPAYDGHFDSTSPIPAGSGCVISPRIGMGISVAEPVARPKSLREIMKEKESNKRD